MKVPPEADLPRAAYAAPQAPWNGIMVVGEAPGAEEVKQNLPFVGRSGQLLDKALAEAGILRAACFVANVFRLQPPGNKVDFFFASRRAAAQNTELLLEDYGAMSGKFCRAAFAAELQALRDVIAAERPRAILAVGRTPLWALTGLNGISAQAGQRHDCRFAAETPVMVTYHPSYILRGNWKLMPVWVEHLVQGRLLAAANGSSPVRTVSRLR